MDYEQRIAKPWTIKIEFTHGCNLACKFCPVGSDKDLRNKDLRRYMDPVLLENICIQLAELEFSSRIELTLRGEPTLNPEVIENLQIIRHYLPNNQITMFSNGITLLKNPKLMIQMIDAGLNVLCIDCYNNTFDKFYSLIHENVDEEFDNIDLLDIQNFNPYKKHSGGNKYRKIVLVHDLSNQDESIFVRKIHNVAGNVDKENLKLVGWTDDKILPLKAKCVMPFRELIIHSDGVVPLCCLDWYDEYIIGNAVEEDIYDIWYGRRHHEVLKSLYAKDRTGVPCNKCDHFGGYRKGFLQDPNVDKE